ncbi:MAG: hypothetical protein HDT29_05670 [Clostridiales bacterium]|nr:hypothetical protein [Clostridiales bacterium]
MKSRTKINVIIGSVLLFFAVLLCVTVGFTSKTTASAATNGISVQTFTGTEETKHNYYGYQSDWGESLYFNTGIKFYGEDADAWGTNSDTNSIKLDVNKFYIDFEYPAPLYTPDDCYAYIDQEYHFYILNGAGQSVFSASMYGSFEMDSNWTHIDYTKQVYVNDELENEYCYDYVELLHFSPLDFGRQLVNIPDGQYTIKITRQYLWTYNYVDDFFVYEYDYHEATSSITGSLVISNSAPTLSISDTSGNKVTSGISTNQRVTFTAAGEFFSRLYYKTPTSTSYVSTTNKTYQIGTTNGWYYVYAEDIFGKQSETMSVFYDGTSPVGTLYANGTTVANGSYINSTFYFIANDTGSGIDSVYYKSPISGIYAPYSSGSIIPVNAGDGWYYFYATDKVGNRSETISVFLETQPPVVEIYKNGTKTYSKAFSTSASFDTDLYLNVNDTLKVVCNTSSGRVTSDHSLNSNMTITNSQNAGNHVITVTSATGITGGFTYHVVKQKPTISIDGVSYPSGTTLYFNTDKTVNFADDTTIVNSADTGATIRTGSNSEFISYASGRSKKLSTATNTQTVYNLTLNDRAGNESNFTVVIDKLAPQGYWQANGKELVNGGYTQQPLTFKFTEAGVTGTYSFNGGEYKSFTSGQTFTADGTYTVILTDLANNRSTYTAHIDTVAPTGQLYANYAPVHSDSITNGRVYFTWDGADNTATVNGQAYEKNTVLTENGIYTFVLTDLAKNSTTYVIEIDTVAPTYNADKLIGSKLFISKWHSVTFDRKDYSFASYTEALTFACAKEFDKSVTVLTLNNVEDFNQHHLIAGNSEVRTGEYWLYKSPANAESYLYYFDRDLLDEVISFYAKEYVSGVNHFIWNGDNLYGDTAASMTDNLLLINGTEAPALNGVVFDKVDGSELYAELVGGNGTRIKLNYGVAFDKQLSECGLYKLTEVDEAHNETVFFGILDTFAPALKVTATIYGNDSANELSITKDSLTSIAAYYYGSFEVGAIEDADKWAVLSITNANATTYYTLGDKLPCLTVGGEYLLTVYDRLGNGFSFTVYIVGNPATITIQNNADDTAFELAITLEQNFDTLVFLEVRRNDEALTNVSTNVLNYTFDRAGYYTITLRDNFGRMITKEYVFNKALPTGTLSGVVNGGKTKTDVVFSFDNTKFYAAVIKDGQDYATNYNGEIYFFATDKSSGFYMVRLIRLTDTENYTDYTFLINTLAPEFDLTVSDGTITNKNIIVSWTASDIVGVTYTLNGGEIIELKSGSVLSDEGEYTVVAVNDLGTQSVKTFTIDKTIDYRIEVGAEPAMNVEVTNESIAVFNDEPLSVSVMKNGEPYGYMFGDILSEEGFYTFRIADDYGNTATFSVTIDKSVSYSANIGNGLIASENVQITNGEKLTVTVTKDNQVIDYIFGQPLDEEGSYKVLMQDAYGNEKSLEFRIVKGVKRTLDYTLGESVSVLTLDRNGEALSPDGNRLYFTESGLYTVTAEVDGKAYSFVLELDSTAPTLDLIGVSNGGVSGKFVMLDNLSEQASVEVFKDGELIKYELGSELKEYGEYRVVVTDVAGNQTEYTFTLKHILNGGAVALIVIGIIVLVGGVAAVLIMRKKGIFGKIKALKTDSKKPKKD